MTDRPERFSWLPTILLIPVLAILIALGVWQVKRLQWKTDLLARIHAAQNGSPQPIAAVLARQARGENMDYARVTADCPDIERTPFLRVFAINEGEPGYRLVTPCTLTSGPYRTVLVDRGFVLQDDYGRLKPGEGRTLTTPLVGVLRNAGKPGWMTPPDDPRANIWRSRNVPAMAAALHAPAPAPLFLMLERPKPEGFGPTPLPVPVDIPNNHLGYALTWFGLAIALVVMHGGRILKHLRSRKAGPRSTGDSR